jgi:hypothetical protein
LQVSHNFSMWLLATENLEKKYCCWIVKSSYAFRSLRLERQYRILEISNLFFSCTACFKQRKTHVGNTQMYLSKLICVRNEAVFNSNFSLKRISTLDRSVNRSTWASHAVFFRLLIIWWYTFFSFFTVILLLYWAYIVTFAKVLQYITIEFTLSITQFFMTIEQSFENYAVSHISYYT